MSATCILAASGGDQSSGRVLCTWTTPSRGVCAADSTQREMQILFDNLPTAISEHLRCHFADRLIDLCELYIQIGKIPECIFADPSTGATTRQDISNEPCTEQHVNMFSQFFGANAETNVTRTKRKGIPGTLHRVSLITHPMRDPEKVLGVAVRVGRSMQGLVETMAWKSFLLDLARQKQSLVLIGKPGVGKTTCLREIARILAEDRSLNVVVVDKTCEVAGDDDAPHSAIGRARWMPVGKPNMQHRIMREAVENQSPDVIIVDEISTPQEVEAARTIAQRGVQLIATVHGRTLPEVIMCKERGNLMGGIASVTLSGSEAERRFDKRKQVQKRAREPIFTAALELHSRSTWILHPSVKDAADSYLEGEPSDAQMLTAGKSVAVASIPGEGAFEYCIDCGHGTTCAQHQAGHIDTATTRPSYGGHTHNSSVNVTTIATAKSSSSLSENRNATNVVNHAFKSLQLSQRSMQSKQQTFSSRLEGVERQENGEHLEDQVVALDAMKKVTMPEIVITDRN
eukprot:CAMPEP_0202703792 /NCGR_PEP_ID=MMETSP1385-20130828/16586_1 /ASSEMBLY_ACC=CAM_ASM_000861 /TAXON_ID=933848 /ORGANISM="Elphidium margaritaceum" /LENGTH=514 /DNA_ID=CAMNT_0049361695 /DNA_START=44 /DNA_END=1589 /DNA_ORIENTATION=+